MMYSIVPPELLLPAYDFQDEIRQVKVKGALVEIRITGEGARLERILSGNLSAFLDTDLAPGQMIKL